MTELLGYWFRFGTPPSTRLHVAKWIVDGLDQTIIHAACGAPLIGRGEEPDRARLQLKPTALAALRSMDANQQAHLCGRCRGVFSGS